MNNCKVLFLVDFYYPVSSANAICIKHLQESLLSQNISSDVICYGSKDGFLINNEFGSVYCVKNSLSLTRDFGKKPISFFEKIHNGIIWPLKSIGVIKSYQKTINNLKKSNNYYGIVCSMRPIEAALSCLKTDFVLYELDSITNNSDNLFGIKKYLIHRPNNIERIIYKKAGLIIHMRFHEKYYNNKKYLRYSAKSIFSDIPGLIDRKRFGNNCNKRNDNKVLICYTGALDSSIRSPKYSLDLFKKVSERVGLELHFYSRGDCEEIINSKEYSNFTFNEGYVSSEKISSVINNSDFLLNIGNHFSGQVSSLPSKTIEYISTGRPIIHIDGGDNDTAKNYIARCSNSLIISPNDSLDSNVEKVLIFLKKKIGFIEDFQVIKQQFKENLPSYTVNILLDYFANRR